jgi:hypothetical protein
MIVIHLLVLGVRGKSPENHPVKPMLELAVNDDEEGFEECVRPELDNWTKYFTEKGELRLSAWQLLGKCAARFPASEAGVLERRVCGWDGLERKS